MSKEHYEALNKAGLGHASAKLLFGFIRILAKKAGPKLKENGYIGLAITSTIDENGKMKPLFTVYKQTGEKTVIPMVTDDIDEAEEETLNQIENGNKG